MPKHASHATLERDRTLSRIVADDEPVSPAALEECLGVLPLGDDDDRGGGFLQHRGATPNATDEEGHQDPRGEIFHLILP